jgi:hypothetical protein
MTTECIKSFSKHQKASLQLWFSHPSPQYGDICTWTWLPAADYGRSDWSQKSDKIEGRTKSVLNSFQNIWMKLGQPFWTAFRMSSNHMQLWNSSFRMQHCMHVTLEPCHMCAGAILQAPVSKFVLGSPNSQEGADGSLHQEQFLIPFLPDSTWQADSWEIICIACRLHSHHTKWTGHQNHSCTMNQTRADIANSPISCLPHQFPV